MKIVTYNVNGLRPRISQFGSLLKLLDSFDADIICFQETKLSRYELRADLVRADGYESFFSCTRTSDKGRTGYSGVATFCRVKFAFSSDEVALPLAAEEGFTGLLENSQGFVSRKDDSLTLADGLEGCSRDDLLKVDSEGRCVITDHGHFVVFNVYGPRAESGDAERVQFKHTFFNVLQKRWESLLRQGRRILVVGDLNIAPAAIDRCDAGPDFEKNEFRRWFRSLLKNNGGPFFDVFRTSHPERRGAYTCWAQSTGAEVFNFGSRIDHILSAGSCLHEDSSIKGHDFIICHVKECDILTKFKRWKPGNTSRWKAERSIKLEGSDHAPVSLSLKEIPSIQQHSTPPLSMRYCPQVHGCQQTLVSMLVNRQPTKHVETLGESSPFSNESFTVHRYSNLSSDKTSASSDLRRVDDVSRTDECSQGSSNEVSHRMPTGAASSQSKSIPCPETKKKSRLGQGSQLSLRSFFQKCSTTKCGVDSSHVDISSNEVDISNSYLCSYGTSVFNDDINSSEEIGSYKSASTLEEDQLDACQPSENEKRNVALLQWQRIQQHMQNSIPLCKGHNEPTVARVVKKAGPNFGRRFYVCARAEGPQSNPEANCGYFKWADAKSKRKR